MSDEALVPPRHEPRDVGLRFALAAVEIVGGSLILAVGLVTSMYPATIGARFVPRHLPPPVTPALQTSPRRDMETFRHAELARLDGVGWTDKAAGRVHIPIAQAMRQLAAEGIPGWPGVPR